MPVLHSLVGCQQYLVDSHSLRCQVILSLVFTDDDLVGFRDELEGWNVNFTSVEID